MRLLLFILGLVALLLGTFALVGSQLEETLGTAALAERFGERPWLSAGAIIGLLIADVLLPIPTTPLLTLSGSLHGALLGGCIGAVGSLAAGLLAYGLCRWMGPRGARWILGERDFSRLRHWFERHGGMTVAMSRWLPMTPEIVAALAGLAGMPVRTFAVALLVGTLPMAFAFAALGASLSERPLLATLIAAIVPALAWPVVRELVGRA